MIPCRFPVYPFQVSPKSTELTYFLSYSSFKSQNNFISPSYRYALFFLPDTGTAAAQFHPLPLNNK